MEQKSKSPEKLRDASPSKNMEDSPRKLWSPNGPQNTNSRIFDFETRAKEDESKLEGKLDKIIWWVNTKYHHPNFKKTIVDPY